MKFRRISQGLVAVAACVGLGLGMTSCSPSDTIDYLYVTSNNASSGTGDGQVTAYHVDSISGALSQVAGTPTDSGGANPVAEIPNPDGKYLYIANHGSNNISEFIIGTDGQLSLGNKYTTGGSDPVSLSMNSAGTLLFVLDYYGPGFSDSNPGPGVLIVYPINSDGTLGTPVASGGLGYTQVQCFPGGVAVTPNSNYVYVSNTNSVIVTTAGYTTPTPPTPPSTCPSQGTISGFAVSTAGALSAIPGSPFLAGATPTAIAVDVTSRFVYTTDSSQNQLIVYDVGSGGALTPLPNGPFATGTLPVGIAIDPRDEYLYVTNYNGQSISGYSISQGTGLPSALASSGWNTGSPGPTCIVVDPSMGRYVYASLSLFNAVSAAGLNPNTGELTGVQNTPYDVTGKATCVTAVPHGNHANQIVPTTSGG
ncbi:MAG TPA: beta-propeller fold lactonase family protein [Acidobacteriaceae bacterium]|jgi:6-phosphogluconolactonase (cycloisomerase 2 family)|nr:beta-propeller fold lactonase family protein [Acidobacteriaceae bacterium]